MSFGGMGSITCCAITCSGSPELHKWVAQGGQWGFKIGRSSGWKLPEGFPQTTVVGIRPRKTDPLSPFRFVSIVCRPTSGQPTRDGG